MPNDTDPWMSRALELESQQDYLKKQVEMLSQSNFDKVKEFHTKVFLKPDPETPTQLDNDQRKLNLKIIYEEFKEVAAELGYEVDAHFTPLPDFKPSLPKLAKELSDLLVTVYGAGASSGIDMDNAFDAVHESNMTKLDKNGKPKFRDDGKLLKSELYREPDMSIIYKE